jgi:hypothetical protein
MASGETEKKREMERDGVNFNNRSCC